MSQTNSQEERPEASLFDNSFTSNPSPSENQSQENNTPDNTQSEDWQTTNVSGCIGLHDHPADDILKRTTPYKENKTICEDTENWVKAEFSVTISRNLLEYLLNCHKSFSSEIVCSITTNGILALTVDAANTSMQKFWIDSSDLDDLTVTTPGIFGIKIDPIDEIISSDKYKDVRDFHLTTEVTKEEIENTNEDPPEDGDSHENEDQKELYTHNLIISTQNVKDPEKTELINPDNLRHPPDLPELDLTAHITMPLRELDLITSRYNECTGHIEIRSIVNGIKFTGEGDITTIEKTYTESTDLISDLCSDIYIHTSPEDRSLFTIEYIRNYLKRLKKSQTDHNMRLVFGNEFPLKAHIKLSNRSYSTLMVAPRIMAD